MTALNSTRWAGVCAGGYFAAAAVYVGNIVALAMVRGGELMPALVTAALPVVCIVMGGLVLAGKRWAPKWAVVVAAGFCAMHFVGLAYLFLGAPTPDAALTRSLQWQLAAAFAFLWFSVLFFAFRLAKGAGVYPNTPIP